MNRNMLNPAFFVLLLGAASLPAAASDCPGFLPANDLKIPVGSARDKGILEAQFHEVLDTVEAIYKPIAAAQGKVLQINRLWTDPSVNANASPSGGKWVLNMYGGMARHEAVTMDGFALVVCHELGHLLGGAPKHAGAFLGWSTIEGQADYYASLKCTRRVFADSSARAFTRVTDGDEAAQKGCESAFSGHEERAVCVRSAMAAKSMAYLLKDLYGDTVTPRFDTPDPKVAGAMFVSHPGTQCRMDTYLAGSLCVQPVAVPVSNTDPAAGVCTRSAGFPGGFRPLCWYKPVNPAELLPPSYRAGGGEELLPAFTALSGAVIPWDAFLPSPRQ